MRSSAKTCRIPATSPSPSGPARRRSKVEAEDSAVRCKSGPIRRYRPRTASGSWDPVREPRLPSRLDAAIARERARAPRPCFEQPRRARGQLEKPLPRRASVPVDGRVNARAAGGPRGRRATAALRGAGARPERLASAVAFAPFRGHLQRTLPRSDPTKARRSPRDAVSMFRHPVLQTLLTRSDERPSSRRAIGSRSRASPGPASALPGRTARRAASPPSGRSVRGRTTRFDRLLRNARCLAVSGQVAVEPVPPRFGRVDHAVIERRHGFLRRDAAPRPPAPWRGAARRRPRPRHRRQRRVGRHRPPVRGRIGAARADPRPGSRAASAAAPNTPPPPSAPSSALASNTASRFGNAGRAASFAPSARAAPTPDRSRRARCRPAAARAVRDRAVPARGTATAAPGRGRRPERSTTASANRRASAARLYGPPDPPAPPKAPFFAGPEAWPGPFDRLHPTQHGRAAQCLTSCTELPGSSDAARAWGPGGGSPDPGAAGPDGRRPHPARPRGTGPTTSPRTAPPDVDERNAAPWPCAGTGRGWRRRPAAAPRPIAPARAPPPAPQPAAASARLAMTLIKCAR